MMADEDDIPSQPGALALRSYRRSHANGDPSHDEGASNLSDIVQNPSNSDIPATPKSSPENATHPLTKFEPSKLNDESINEEEQTSTQQGSAFDIDAASICDEKFSYRQLGDVNSPYEGLTKSEAGGDSGNTTNIPSVSGGDPILIGDHGTGMAFLETESKSVEKANISLCNDDTQKGGTDPNLATIAAARSSVVHSHENPTRDASAGPVAGLDTSSQTGLQQRLNDKEEEDDEEEDFHFDDPEIRRDAADHAVACMVHLALAFFLVLFIAALTIAIIIVSEFGFIAFGAISALVTIVGVSGYYVWRVMMDDKKLKPVRRKLRRWRAIAKAVVVQEIRAFQVEMHEHLLLTDGTTAGYENYHGDDESRIDESSLPGNNAGAAATPQCAEPRVAAPPSSGKKKRGRSVLFGIVKPFLKGRIRRKKPFPESTRSRKGRSGADEYVPPIAEIA